MNKRTKKLFLLAFVRRPATTVIVIGLIHRGILFWHLRPALLALVAKAPDFQAVQLLPLPIYREHFWTGIWLLQQTPPVMHFVFRLVLLAGGWPFRTAELLCVLQGVISALAAGLLCALIVHLTKSRRTALFLSLWFLLSTDLVVTEYALFGQGFYEDLGMLGLLACCWQACRIAGAETTRQAGLLGALAAMTALTRSSLSLFPCVLAALGALSWRKRVLAAFLIPVLLLQGGWAVKTWIVTGRISPETSSWAGMNVAKGIFWANQYAQLCADIAAAPAGRYAAWFSQGARHCGLPFEISKTEALPPALLAADTAMTTRLGGVQPVWNLPSVAAESDAWRAAVIRFTLAHPVLFAKRFALGYRLLWQRIADHARQFPWNLLYVRPLDRPFPGLLSRGFGEAGRIATDTRGRTARPGRKAWLGAISLAPLDSIGIVVLHALLPMLLLIDLLRRRQGHAALLPAGTAILVTTVFYGLALFSVAEGGENMRFRIAIEPEIITLVACTWVGLKTLSMSFIAAAKAGSVQSHVSSRPAVLVPHKPAEF